jgi:hypothetical protein
VERDDVSSAEPPSVEERLRHVRECCRLLADLFSTLSEVAYVGGQTSLSVDACNALTTICRDCGDDLERLVRQIPPSISNWQSVPITHRV